MGGTDGTTDLSLDAADEVCLRGEAGDRVVRGRVPKTLMHLCRVQRACDGSRDEVEGRHFVRRECANGRAVGTKDADRASAHDQGHKHPGAFLWGACATPWICGQVRDHRVRL